MNEIEYELTLFGKHKDDLQLTIGDGGWIDDLVYKNRSHRITNVVADASMVRQRNPSTISVVHSRDGGEGVMYILSSDASDTEVDEVTSVRKVRWV